MSKLKMSEHFLGSNKGFENLANFGQDPRAKDFYCCALYSSGSTPSIAWVYSLV
jgi:hypothetical protein